MAATEKEKAIAALTKRLASPDLSGEEFDRIMDRIERLQQLA